MRRKTIPSLFVLLSVLLLSACGAASGAQIGGSNSTVASPDLSAAPDVASQSPDEEGDPANESGDSAVDGASPSGDGGGSAVNGANPAGDGGGSAVNGASPEGDGSGSAVNGANPAGGGESGGSSEENPAAEIATVADPDSITVLVNKKNKLPEDYSPSDLVYPDVRFTFDEKIEKRMMVKEAADALERLFAAADEDGVPLAGVSAYRSHDRQKQLFESYVKKDGLKKAQTYSAYPGTSEHETGLAIDVAGSDGKCSAEDCFAGTPEAEWLADHAHEYGFIIRYPKGKEEITGYKYEPWHLRYVGLEAAAEIDEKNITLEEYEDAVKAGVPVS